MKQAIIGVVSALFVLFSAAFVYIVETRITMEKSLSDVASIAVSNAIDRVSKELSLNSDDILASVEDELELMLQDQNQSHPSQMKVEPIVIDPDFGIVAVNVSLDYKYPMGIDGKVTTTKVAIVEKTQATFAKVSFLLKTQEELTPYKEYEERVGKPFVAPGDIEKFSVFDENMNKCQLPDIVTGDCTYILVRGNDEKE